MCSEGFSRCGIAPFIKGMVLKKNPSSTHHCQLIVNILITIEVIVFDNASAGRERRNVKTSTQSAARCTSLSAISVCISVKVPAGR